MEKRSIRLGIEMKKQLGEYIERVYKKDIKSIIIKKEIIIINVKGEGLKNLIKFLKKHSIIKCSHLMDIWGVDYPGEKERFEVNYLLLSVRYNIRIIIKVTVEEEGMIESIQEIYKSAGWLEREVWDMYGVYFTGHNDLRRILTDYGFTGHPLRKDFPLSGYTEVRYDDGEKRVVEEPIELAQEFRYYSFSSPWEKKEIKSK